MGKKNVNKGDSAVEAAHSTRKGPEGGILFSSGDMILEATRQQARLNHVTKPWTREGWERARPWVLEQRQKLETQGWTPVDGARTELFVLRKNAPHGADTEDGFLYVRIPKKFIDFNRSGKPDQSEAGDESVLGEGKKGRRISSRRKELSYDLSNPDIWKIKIDGEAENSEVEANVQLDVIEPLENLFYLTMTLQPGLARLMATRKEVVQNGTRESDTRDDPEGQTIRHRAMIAAEEGYMRVMAPAYWYRRNETWLRKILTDPAFEACLRAAEDPVRATEHTIKDVREKVWEEKVKVDEKTLGADGKPKKVKKAPRFNAIAAASCLGTAAA